MRSGTGRSPRRSDRESTARSSPTHRAQAQPRSRITTSQRPWRAKSAIASQHSAAKLAGDRSPIATGGISAIQRRAPLRRASPARRSAQNDDVVTTPILLANKGAVPRRRARDGAEKRIWEVCADAAAEEQPPLSHNPAYTEPRLPLP
jgi:hypothetical protein